MLPLAIESALYEFGVYLWHDLSQFRQRVTFIGYNADVIGFKPVTSCLEILSRSLTRFNTGKELLSYKVVAR